jgi:hypothetical protein
VCQLRGMLTQVKVDKALGLRPVSVYLESICGTLHSPDSLIGQKQ